MFWAGRDPKRSPSPSPLPQAGTPLTRSGCTKPHPTQFFEQFQWWGIHSFSGQSAPVPLCSHNKEFLSDIILFFFFSLNPITSSLITTFPNMLPLQLSYMLLLNTRGTYNALQAEHVQFFQLVFIEVSLSSDHPSGFPLNPLQRVHVPHMLRAPELNAVVHVGSHESVVEGKNHPQPPLLLTIIPIQGSSKGSQLGGTLFSDQKEGLLPTHTLILMKQLISTDFKDQDENNC